MIMVLEFLVIMIVIIVVLALIVVVVMAYPSLTANMSTNGTNTIIPMKYRRYAHAWRIGYSDGARVREPRVNKEVADYSADQFRAYMDGYTARVDRERGRTTTLAARTEIVHEIAKREREYRKALREVTDKTV